MWVLDVVESLCGCHVQVCLTQCATCRSFLVFVFAVLVLSHIQEAHVRLQADMLYKQFKKNGYAGRSLRYTL